MHQPLCPFILCDIGAWALQAARLSCAPVNNPYSYGAIVGKLRRMFR
jgi:hypothetical protein